MAACYNLFAFLALAGAILAYMILKQKWEAQHMEKVIRGLEKEEKSAKISKKFRAAVGFGSCMDIFVDGLAVFEKLGVAPPEHAVHHELIRDMSSFAETFAYFMDEGAASEYVLLILIK